VKTTCHRSFAISFKNALQGFFTCLRAMGLDFTGAPSAVYPEDGHEQMMRVTAFISRMCVLVLITVVGFAVIPT